MPIHQIALSKKRRPPQKKSRPYRPLNRAELLSQLRRESDMRSGTQYSTYENSLLVDLARRAAYSRGRSILWRGILFPLRHSLWIVVIDPDTGKPLVSTQGGIL